MTPYNVHAEEPFNQHRIIATGSRVDCADELLAQFHQFDRYAAEAEQVMPRVNAAIGKPADAAMAATAG